MECNNCIHYEVCKYIGDFESSKKCIDRTLFKDKPIVIESKCNCYKSKEVNQWGNDNDYINQLTQSSKLPNYNPIFKNIIK